jgi:hypothetical protein
MRRLPSQVDSEQGQTYCGSRGSHEDDSTEVRSTLVAQSTSGVDESADAIALEGGADEGSAPGNGGGAGLPGVQKLILGVGELGTLVGLAEEGSEDCLVSVPTLVMREAVWWNL